MTIIYLTDNLLTKMYMVREENNQDQYCLHEH